MPLRPIDAIFVHPERRIYVVYYRGELWQLPRMKIDDTAWQHRQPYDGEENAFYLSSHQAISDPVLAQKLRTLNLPPAIYGSNLPRFEAWWKAHGFNWLKDQLTTGQSPLAAHAKTAGNQSTSNPNIQPSQLNNVTKTSAAASSQTGVQSQAPAADIFAGMLADLAEEVRHHPL